MAPRTREIGDEFDAVLVSFFFRQRVLFFLRVYIHDDNTRARLERYVTDKTSCYFLTTSAVISVGAECAQFVLDS